jgi:phosphotransferase system HPr-like phosphotransfer protein
MIGMVGEAGPEAIIPLDKLGSVGGNGQTNITINVQGADPNATVRALEQYVRQSGAVPIVTTTNRRV